MKGIPIVQSKLNMPLMPPSVLFSERMVQLCRDMSGRHGVFITAPAGYGKTTLLLAAMNDYTSRGHNVRWYRLDQDDQDLAVFYTYLVEMLFPGDQPEELRSQINWGDILSSHHFVNSLICQKLWDFSTRQPEQETFLVFDDFHQVRDIPEISNAVGYLIDNLPRGFTVVVSCRWDTGLLSGKRRLEKNILQVDFSHLCFSGEETAELMKSKFGIDPGPGLLKNIMNRTEGWPAGILLLCQIRDRFPQEMIFDMLDHPVQKEILFEYILSEVFTSEDDPLLGFLVKLVLLPEFTAHQAAQVFSEKRAPEILEGCHKRGLFLQKIALQETTYRFHSLFREALQQVQHRYITPEDVKKYHLLAAAYDMEHGFFHRAIEHFVLGGHIQGAVELISRESVRLLAFEAVEELRLWLRLLPEETVTSNGHLLYIKSFINYQKDPDNSLALLERSLELFRQAGDEAMQVYSMVAMAHLHVQKNDITALQNVRRQVLALRPARSDGPFRDMLAVFDYTVAVWEEDFALANQLLKNLNMMALKDDWNWMRAFYASQLHCLRGDLETAERYIQEVLDQDISSKAELLGGYARLIYSFVLLMKDDTANLAAALEETAAAGEKHDYKYLLGFAKRIAAFSWYRQHDPENALRLLDESTAFFQDIGNDPLAASNFLYRCLWTAGDIQFRDILSEAEEAIKTLEIHPPGLCLREIGLSLFGAAAREAGDYDLAEKSLEAALKGSIAKGTSQVTAGILVHTAKLMYDLGRHQEGDSTLEKAMSLIEESRFVMLWDLHYPTFVEMAARCLQGGIHPGCARMLVERYFGTAAAEYLSREAAPGKTEGFGKLTAAFLSRYGPENQVGPKVYFNLFGRFHMAVGGVIVPETEWKTKKIPGMLKYLLANRNSLVSKDRLMDVFWPGTDKKLASTSLRAALYELKKVFRRYGIAHEGKISLLTESRDSLGIFCGKSVSVDVDLFLTCLKELSGRYDTGRKKRKELLEELVSLYRGDFLEEEIYEDWTFSEREALKSAFFESAIELSGIYIGEGDTKKGEILLLKILSIDRYNEEACLRLLKLYVSTNQRSRAVKLCSHFSDRFEKDLGIKPDKRLSAVIEDPK